MKLKLLTPAQQQVYLAISTHFVETGSTPTFEKLAERLGGRSLATVSKHVHNLEKLGMLKLRKGRIQGLNAQVCPTCGHKAASA